MRGSGDRDHRLVRLSGTPMPLNRRRGWVRDAVLMLLQTHTGPAYRRREGWSGLEILVRRPFRQQRIQLDDDDVI